MMLPYIKIFPDLSATLELLADAEAGKLLKALVQYANGKEVNLPGPEKLVFAMLKAQIDRDAASYQQFTDKQRENGSKGGRPKKAKPFEENPKNPGLFSKTQKTLEKEEEKEKEEDKEYITHSYASTTNNAHAREASQAPKMSGGPLIQKMIKLGVIREAGEVVEKNAQIAPPTYDDVREYAFSHHLEELVDAEDFVNHYRSTGWMAGKTPVTDWTAQVDKWAARARKEEYGY